MQRSPLIVLAGVAVVAAVGAVSWLTRGTAGAHCDTLDGPVVKDARAALEKGDVTVALKWVAKADEDEIRAAFKKTLAVRGKGAEARELADSYFFETLVRIHRAGEGAPFTGLKPAGADLDPAVKAADKALEDGHVDALVDLVTKDVAEGIRKRFAAALEKRKHAGDSVEAGREYVGAYVDYVHFAEGIHAATERTHRHGEAEVEGAAGGHEHGQAEHKEAHGH